MIQTNFEIGKGGQETDSQGTMDPCFETSKRCANGGLSTLPMPCVTMTGIEGVKVEAKRLGICENLERDWEKKKKGKRVDIG